MTWANGFFFMVPGIFLLFGIFLAFLWLSDRRSGAALAGAVAFTLAAAGILLDALRPDDHEWARYAALVIHFVAVAVFVEAFALRHGQRLPRAGWALVVVGSLLFFPYSPLRSMTEVRLVAVQLIAFGIIATIVPQLRRWSDGSAVSRLVFGAIILAALSYLGRAVLFGVVPEVLRAGGGFFGNFYNLIFHLTTAVVGFGMGLTLLVALGSDAVRRENRESAIDPLTGLGNRRRLGWAINAHEKGEWECGGAIVIDLDHFKSINDRFGHDGGDTVLVAVADALRFVFRGQRVCRLGGEEFVALVPRDQAGQIERLAREALAAIESLQFAGELASCRVSACVGWTRRADDESIEETIRRADRAVYHGKANGRGQVCAVDAPTEGGGAPVRLASQR